MGANAQASGRRQSLGPAVVMKAGTVNAQEDDASGQDKSAPGPVSGATSSAPRAAQSEPTIGTIINGKYRVDAILGRGAMGVVAECRHVELRERVALKFSLTTGQSGGEDFRARFLREAQVSAKLKNKHITRVVDVGIWRESIPYMVMEHLDGVDLRAAIRAAGRLAPAQAVDYAVQVCEGIAEAHAIGVVHRDLKPSNLFLVRRPDGSELVKIIDFGISKVHGHDGEVGEATATGVILGSPKYMSPEQMFAAPEVDARADVWSIGAILYEMLTGRAPFASLSFGQLCEQLLTDRPPPSICALASDVPPVLQSVVLRCLERSLDRRIQNVAELASELLKAVGSPLSRLVHDKIEATLCSPRSHNRLPVADRTSSRPPTGWYTPRTVDGAHGSKPRSDTPMARGTSISILLEAPKRRRRVWVAVAVACLFVCFGAVASIRGRPKKTAEARQPEAPRDTAVSAAVSLPPSRAEPVEPVTRAENTEKGLSGPVTTGRAIPPSQELQNRTRHPVPPVRSPGSVVLPPARGVPSTAVTKPPVSASCDPPYLISVDGVKAYKPECF